MKIKSLNTQQIEALRELPAGLAVSVNGAVIKCSVIKDDNTCERPCDKCVLKHCRPVCIASKLCFAHRRRDGRSVYFSEADERRVVIVKKC